jgi:hypothetical protein
MRELWALGAFALMVPVVVGAIAGGFKMERYILRTDPASRRWFRFLEFIVLLASLFGVIWQWSK